MVRNADSDDCLFLAGGVAFNVLLAGVPFLMLLAAGLGYLLDQSPDAATAIAEAVLRGLLPMHSTGESLLDLVLADVVRTRAIAGFWGAVGFLWFCTRLFASLRSVMTVVFDRPRDRGYLHGKLWDLHLTLTSMFLMAVWVTISTWLIVTSGRVGVALQARGLLQDATRGIEYVVGRVLSILVIVAIFFSLYRWLPRVRTPARVALTGALAAGALFELARWLFGVLSRAFPPSSIYVGTLGALVLVVFWTYYAALIFVLGAEVAHVAQGRLAALGIAAASTDPEPAATL